MRVLILFLALCSGCLISEMSTDTGCARICLHSYYNSTAQICQPYEECKHTHILNVTTNTCIPECNHGRLQNKDCACDPGWKNTETAYCSLISQEEEIYSSDDFWFIVSLVSMICLSISYISICTIRLRRNYKRNALTRV